MTDIESLRLLTEAVETAGADIAPTYAEYVQLAFAIATDCGEAGREFFHRLCRISAKYQSAHAERMFSNALTKQQGAIHLGTAFHLAESTGVKICREDRKKVMNNRTGTVGTESSPHNFSTHAHVYNKVEEEKSESEELLEGSDPHHPLPTFTLEDWPKLLLRIISYGTTVTQKDVLLLGALTALGATMERYVRCHYAGKYQSPCMQSFIVAPAASGKGVLSLIRLLVMPIHDDIRQQVEKEMNAYKKAKVAYEMMGKERAKAEIPEMPLNRMFLISGNNTGTGILQNIIDSDGTGIIFETEADTITTAIGGDYGHWSDTLRNAFDHAGLSFNRRTDNEYRECDSTFLSMVLSGTPGQVAPLIPSGENGLFSREVFYYKSQIREWIDQFSVDEVDAEKEFHRMGYEWKATIDQLKCRGTITLRLDERQQAAFNDSFVRLFLRARQSNGQEMNSSVVRLAINLVRFMEVVAMLRALEQPELLLPAQGINSDNLKDKIIGGWELHITDDDFAALLTMAEPLYLHATHILSFLPTGEITSRGLSEKDSLLSSMPDEFTTVQWMEAAEHANIPKNTAKTWLRRLCDSGALLHGEHKGIYLKPL